LPEVKKGQIDAEKKQRELNCCTRGHEERYIGNKLPMTLRMLQCEGKCTFCRREIKAGDYFDFLANQIWLEKT
jgi:hypothetical protein